MSPLNVVTLACLLLAVGPASAHADKCTGAKLKAVAKKASALLGCQAKVAATGDSSGLTDCETKAMDKFGTGFGKTGTCAGAEAECETIADQCESAVAAAMSDSFPSKCEAAKRKAAAELAKGELGCYSKAAAKGVAVDGACITKAANKFTTALTKAGACADGGSPKSLVDSKCVAEAVTVSGGMVVDVCPPPGCCQNPTFQGMRTFACAAPLRPVDCTAEGGTPVSGAVCDESGCETPPGMPGGCCEVSGGCVAVSGSNCAGTLFRSSVCEPSGTCQTTFPRCAAGAANLSACGSCGEGFCGCDYNNSTGCSTGPYFCADYNTLSRSCTSDADCSGDQKCILISLSPGCASPCP